jgi:hypothetical protein
MAMKGSREQAWLPVPIVKPVRALFCSAKWDAQNLATVATAVVRALDFGSKPAMIEAPRRPEGMKDG